MDHEVKEAIIGKEFEASHARIKASSIDEKNFTATFILSTEDIDRHGDIVDQESWNLKHFEENPVLLEQHKGREYSIGRFTKLYFEPDPNNVGKQMLVGDVVFAVKEYDRAKIAFALVKGGFMRTVSVGFIPRDVDYDEDRDAYVLKMCELVEVSLVSVPSNRRALVKMKMKELGLDADVDKYFDEADEKVKNFKAKEEAKKDAKQKAIEVKEEIEKSIKDNPQYRVQNNKAVEYLHKAIRNIKI